MYYTYVLQYTKDQKLYVGFSDDLKRRLRDYNDGKVTATQYRRPLRLVYYKASLDKIKAVQREKYFKTGFGRRFLKERLNLDKLSEVMDG